MIESVAGIIMALPMPMLARTAIGMPTEPERRPGRAGGGGHKAG